MSTTTAKEGPASCRRRRARRELPFALLYADFRADNGGVVLNLSEDGFCVRTAMPLVAGNLFGVRLRGGRDGGRMDASGKVVWMSDSRKTAGVRFVEISEPARRQIKKWLALVAPLDWTEQGVSNNPSQKVTLRAPSDAEQALSDQNDDQIMAGFSPSLGAIAGATILLLSVLIFGLVRLSGSGNLNTEPDDAARILNAGRAEGEPVGAPSRVDKSHNTLTHGLSDDGFQSRSASGRSQPNKSIAPHILASPDTSPNNSAPLSDGSLQSAVGPNLGQWTAASQKSGDHPLSHSPESVSPMEAETDHVPIALPRPDRTLLADAPPIKDSLAAADVATSSETNVLPGIYTAPSAPPVTNGAQNGRAAPLGTPPGHLDSAHLIQSVPPVYPPEAKKKRLEGMVELRLVVDTDGQVRSVNLVSGSPLLAPAAMDAARQFRYSPALLDGRPIETIQTAEISFQLKH